MKRGIERERFYRILAGCKKAPAKRKANKVTKIAETAAPALINPREVKPQKRTKEACTKGGGKKNATHKRRLKPELIIISKKGDMAYADILRKIKSDPELMDLGENVRLRADAQYARNMLI